MDAVDNQAVAENTAPASSDGSVKGEKMPRRNFIMFPLGTVGRDFLYQLWNGYLLTYIIFTKNLTTAQFVMVTVIIVLARIFDAFNDPFMGGIVENTRTKWGKYKPWQLIGAILTGGVIVALFNVDLDGWAFIGFLALMYFFFSITYTMNDISYWGMLPSLTSDPDERNKLTSFSQLAVSLGGGLAGIAIPLFTTGDVAMKWFGGAQGGFAITSIIVVVVMVGFQMFTLFGVKEKPLPPSLQKVKIMRIRDIVKVIRKNDQLLWCSLLLLLWTILSAIGNGNLLTYYIYFEFGYQGMLGTIFFVFVSILSVAFTLFYPWFSKKLGRDRTLYSCGISLIVSYAILLALGVALPNEGGFTIPILNLPITYKFFAMALGFALTGWANGFYMVMLINITNTVEYNEWKTGSRDEALIFSMRPLTSKLGSAITQGLVSLVLIITGARLYTNQIADVERMKDITADEKSSQVAGILGNMDPKVKTGVLICMCVIPIVLMIVALVIYKLKCKLNEPTLAKMIEEIEERKAAEAEEQAEEESAEESEAAADEVVEETTEDKIVKVQAAIAQSEAKIARIDAEIAKLHANEARAKAEAAKAAASAEEQK